MMETYYDRAGIVLYHGDCLEILPQLEAGSVDAVVTDPPYGIGYVGHLRNAIEYGTIRGDESEFDPTPWVAFPFAILWGANNYPHRLPTGGWIVWDKRLGGAADRILGSPFELAWCSKRTHFKIIRVLHGGAKNADAPNGDVHNQARYHPTQKPVRVMQACCEFTKIGGRILDPYLGSGSTGIACIRTGRRFIGIEIEEKYCEIAAKRIERELAQPMLPCIERPEAIPQRELFAEAVA